MKQLSALADTGLLAPIDAELGALLGRRAAASLSSVSQVEHVAMAGALLSAERARGNSCLDLRTLAGTSPWPMTGTVMPDFMTWRDSITRSGLCGAGTEPSPLVLEGDRLYLYRYHAAERRLASAVRERLSSNQGDAEPDATSIDVFRRLFAVGPGSPTDWQAVAAAAAMRNRLTVITGGPGTGKTTTVARILALMLQREPELSIALAAPTGKAAARLCEAIHGVVKALPVAGAVSAKLPRDGQTLHRLLAYNPQRDRFARCAESPLGADVIVVDEASMVDLLMMDALFAAARPAARIILLGDKDQLVSVDTGYVLGDLCEAADDCGSEHGEMLAKAYAQLSGQSIEVNGGAAPLRDAVVRLQRSYRFEHRPGIGALAESIRRGAGRPELDELFDGRYAGVQRRESSRNIGELLAPVQPLITSYLGATDPVEALECYSAFRLLCALRDGPAGVAGLNEGIERWLRASGVPTRSRWYDHRPVLVTANDRMTGLFNGDVGIVLTTAGRTLVYFPDSGGGARALAPARLPRHETAWAMTVHKSQGSEFQHVLLVLPDQDNRVLTRELLYTGVTRARDVVDVVAKSDVFAAAVARTTVRTSGLATRLTGE